ncbi:MAG: hypothetical protein SCALA702_33700 [Melioribacteraceae bacterium]|nr:MAG: hypothetical protein SCALA702_33700 [Melioribacteraceae bacterium]
MKKILILHPAYTAKGGISNYFKVLENKFSLPVDYMVRGSRTWPERKGAVAEILRALQDLFIFIGKLLSMKYGAIQTSTSLGSFAVIRDGIFVLAAKLLGVKAIVFFRGWDEDFEKILVSKYLNLFRFAYFKADTMIVLSSEFRTKLENWGYKKEIHLETTIVDETLIDNLAEEEIVQKFENPANLNILFLARVEIPKGIYEAVDTFSILKQKHPGIKFTIAGDGFELEKVKAYVKDNKIQDVYFTGHVAGDDKVKAFRSGSIYFFPSYTEGMPNSVLEAMAVGLPVVGRPVGGLIDILEDGKTGFATDSKSPEVFAELFEKLIAKPDLCKSIAINNHRTAKEKFILSKVIERIESIYKKVL